MEVELISQLGGDFCCFGRHSTSFTGI
jgi:hypothetical protein